MFSVVHVYLICSLLILMSMLVVLFRYDIKMSSASSRFLITMNHAYWDHHRLLCIILLKSSNKNVRFLLDAKSCQKYSLKQKLSICGLVSADFLKIFWLCIFSTTMDSFTMVGLFRINLRLCTADIEEIRNELGKFQP